MIKKAESKCCVFYTTDEGYLFPTLASALLLRQQINYNAAEIRVVLTNVRHSLSQKLKEFFATYQIHVSELDLTPYTNFDVKKFNKTHVPTSCLARFFMTACSPGDYDRILYLDGDTWITGDVKPLIDYVPPPGTLAAAEGLCYFHRNDMGPTGDWTRKYFGGIGISGDDGYFNSGVLLADKSTWQKIADEAFRYFLENIELCKYHDESALNAVAQKRRIRLSPKWNFVTNYWDWDAQKITEPSILHFAGGFKPWTARLPPFEKIFDKYNHLEREINLDLSRKRLDDHSVIEEGRKRQRYKTKLNTIFLQRLLQRRKQFKNICKISAL